MIKTVNLTGEETKIEVSDCYHVSIKNNGSKPLYVSANPNIVPGADGVLRIGAGESACYLDCDGTVYLKGEGEVSLCGVQSIVNPFGSSGGSGSSSADEIARAAINAHESNSDLHFSADKVSNPNLLINPDFRINQRGKTGVISDAGYFVDRWQLVSGTAEITADGIILNGTMKQILENAVGADVTASASAGTASYDDNTRMFTLAAAGETITWAKLEIGNIATQFVPPDPMVEALKCGSIDEDTPQVLFNNGMWGDISSNLAIQAMYPTNKLIYDDKGKPSVMVYIPKFKMSDVIEGASSNVHPAFIVNGVEKDGIWISKYQNVVDNNCAYSLPAKDPAVNINSDTSRSRCESKGKGWHLMSAMEWGALALWCKKNGWLPWGNNHFGKDTRETMYKAVPIYKDETGRIGRVGTGTGAVEWSHNKQLDGIYDLNGNVWEWVDGMRLVYGELQILENNNAADSGNDKTEASEAWKAINGVTGELITPDGNGTTANSIKLDFVDNAWKWITGTISGKSDSQRKAAWASTTADTTICDASKELLYALALMPDSTTFDYEGDVFYANNGIAERFPYRGGGRTDGAACGVFALTLNHPRSIAFGNVGFRSAFY